MTDPSASTATGIAAGAGIGITGTIMGADAAALLLGLMAAVFMSMWTPAINDRLRAASAVAMASLLAGYGAPVAASWLAASYGTLVDAEPLRGVLAVAIGMGVPPLLPAMLARAQSIITPGGAK